MLSRGGVGDSLLMNFWHVFKSSISSCKYLVKEKVKRILSYVSPLIPFYLSSKLLVTFNQNIFIIYFLRVSKLLRKLTNDPDVVPRSNWSDSPIVGGLVTLE